MRFLPVHIIFVVVLGAGNLFAADSGQRKIKHTGASDGLSRIDANGVYYYDVVNELKNQSSHIRLGAASNPEVSVEICQVTPTDECASVTSVTFDDIYTGASKLSLGYDYEYFFTTSGGKLGGQLGFSAQYAQGAGRLAIDPTKSSIEKFTFLTLPLYLGGIYRFEYKDKQLFAPYVSGGGVYMVLLEKREDASKVNGIGAPGFYAAGGVLFNVTAFDRDMASEFNSEYGISNLWINLEFKTVNVESDAFSYQSNYIQSGLSFDF
jgi:hypothetical protein